LEKAVVQQFQDLGAEKISVSALGTAGSSKGITNKDLEVIRRTRGVDVAAGQMIDSIIMSFGDKTRNSYVATLPRNTVERNFIISTNNYDVVVGRMLKPDERTKIVLGSTYKDRPIFDRLLRIGDDVNINGEYFEIVGFLERTGSFQVDSVVLMNEDAARFLFDKPDVFSVIQVVPINVQDIDVVAENIRHDLRKSRNVRIGKEDFSVATSQDILDSLNNILSVVTYFLIGIAAISILVGGVGVMNTMFTSILERTKEIGIMKAIGARNSDILLMFLFESGLLGLVGGLIGLGLGMSLGLLVQTLGRLLLGTSLVQAVFTLELIFGALFFSFLIGAIAGLLPAYRASIMKPVDALRQ